MQNSNEIQLVVLSNLKLIVQKFPNLITGEFKIFYCKYNDPIYVKLAKLEVLQYIINENNVVPVLAELFE